VDMMFHKSAKMICWYCDDLWYLNCSKSRAECTWLQQTANKQ